MAETTDGNTTHDERARVPDENEQGTFTPGEAVVATSVERIPGSAPERTPYDDEAEPGEPYDGDDDEADDALDDEMAEPAVREPKPTSYVRIPRALFWPIAAAAVLLIAGLGAATAMLARADRTGNTTVVATVNGEKITRGEYDRAVAAQSGSQILDNLVTDRLIKDEAKKRGITVDGQAVAKQMDDIRGRFSSDQEYQMALKQNGLTEDDLTQRVQVQQLAQQLVADKIQVTDDEITNQYNSNKDQYNGKSLNDVRDQIKSDLQQQKMQTALPPLINDLRSNAKIETHIPGESS